MTEDMKRAADMIHNLETTENTKAIVFYKAEEDDNDNERDKEILCGEREYVVPSVLKLLVTILEDENECNANAIKSTINIIIDEILERKKNA